MADEEAFDELVRLTQEMGLYDDEQPTLAQWREARRAVARKHGELATLVGGEEVWTHPKAKCAGGFCTIHNPSAHHMADWPQHWRGDRGIMERLCPHGVGHPDPDDLGPRHDPWLRWLLLLVEVAVKDTLTCMFVWGTYKLCPVNRVDGGHYCCLAPGHTNDHVCACSISLPLLRDEP